MGHSFSVYIFICIRSQPLLFYFLKEETGSRRGKQSNKRTHPPLPCVFFICAIARQFWVFGDFRPFGDYRPLPRLLAHITVVICDAQHAEDLGIGRGKGDAGKLFR